jgi:hypothetical protein
MHGPALVARTSSLCPCSAQGATPLFSGSQREENEKKKMWELLEGRSGRYSLHGGILPATVIVMSCMHALHAMHALGDKYLSLASHPASPDQRLTSSPPTILFRVLVSHHCGITPSYTPPPNTPQTTFPHTPHSQKLQPSSLSNSSPWYIGL